MFKSLDEARQAYFMFQDLEESIKNGMEILNGIYRKHKDKARGHRFDSLELDDIDWDLGYANLTMHYYSSCGGDQWSTEFPLKYLGMSEEEMEAAYLKEKEDAAKIQKQDTLIAPDTEVEESIAE